MSVSALFVDSDSVYKRLLGAESCWDAQRDARTWPGGNAVVSHPPCRLWSRMRSFSTADLVEKELGICALAQVIRWGGVLEHPAGSGLWKEVPVDVAGVPLVGFFISVDQFWFGHKCRKATILYIVGCRLFDLPLIPLCFDAIRFRIGGVGSKSILKEVSKKERSATPEPFARWLIEVAELCNKGMGNVY